MSSGEVVTELAISIEGTALAIKPDTSFTRPIIGEKNSMIQLINHFLTLHRLTQFIIP